MFQKRAGQAAVEAFYNTSSFTLRDVQNRARKQQLKANIEFYLDGFSQDAQELVDKFRFPNQIATLIEADIFGHLIEKFLDSRINLSLRPVMDEASHELLYRRMPEGRA